MRKTFEYLKAKNIPHKKNGKLVVAVTPGEVPTLRALMANAQQNGVPDLRFIDCADGIREVEPECSGLAAIHSPHTGIVDWAVVARSYAEDLLDGGGDVLLNHEVTAISESHDLVTIATANRANPAVRARQVLTCSGAYADRVASLSGGAHHPQILPVRGEYLRIPAGTLDIRGSIYPVPAPGVPFLGVHFTPLLNGDIILGPSAVLALSRDGYRASDVSTRDVRDMVANPGFWRLLARHASYGLGEAARTAVPGLAVRRAQAYVPKLRVEHVERGAGLAGVRAQAVSREGGLVEDFVFERSKSGRVVNCRNLPSPAATSSLAISEMVVDYLQVGS